MTEVEGRHPETGPDPQPGGRSIVARHPQLRAILGAEALSATGDAVFWVGLLVWLLGRPDGTELIALAAVARLAPRVVFGPAGGVIADRYDRRILLVALDSVRAVLMLGLAFMVDANNSATLVLAGVLVIYVLAAPYRPALSAGIPFAVGERDAAGANALDGSVRQVATFLGPLIGTAALWLGAPSWALGVNAVTFALSAILLARVTSLKGKPPASWARRAGRRSWWRSLREGVESTLHQPGLTLTMWLVFVFSVARGFELVLLVLVAEDRLRMGAKGVGILNAAIGVGALAAVPLVRSIANIRRPAAAVVISLFLTSIPLALLGVIDNGLIACAVLLAVGVGVVVFEVLAVTFVQRLSRIEVLGRVFGIQNMAVYAGKLVGALLGPLLVTMFSLEDALLIAAVLVSVSAIVAVPRLHRVAKSALARGDALAPIVQVFANLALFDGASEPALERLAGTAERAVMAAGVEAVREGDRPDDVYVIRSGEFDVVKQGVKVATLGPDEWFGEIGLLRDTPRTATVIAVTDAEVWQIHGAEFLAAINESAVPPTALLEGISARLEELDGISRTEG
jgi:predicted MFS family arabinose efflux permease